VGGEREKLRVDLNKQVSRENSIWFVSETSAKGQRLSEMFAVI
jgi:hypothetical protein